MMRFLETQIWFTLIVVCEVLKWYSAMQIDTPDSRSRFIEKRIKNCSQALSEYKEAMGIE